MENLKGRKRNLESPLNEYRHNILNTGRESTKPNSTFDHGNSPSNIGRVSSVLNLPSIDLFKSRMHQLGQRSHITRTIQKLGSNRTRSTKRFDRNRNITINNSIFTPVKNSVKLALPIRRRRKSRKKKIVASIQKGRMKSILFCNF